MIPGQWDGIGAGIDGLVPIPARHPQGIPAFRYVRGHGCAINATAVAMIDLGPHGVTADLSGECPENVPAGMDISSSGRVSGPRVHPTRA